jgi:hypothetical protein
MFLFFFVRLFVGCCLGMSSGLLPRGGHTAGIAPLEVRKIKKEVEDDLLFGRHKEKESANKPGKKMKKKAKPKAKLNEVEKPKKEIDSISFLSGDTPFPKKVPEISYHSLKSVVFRFVLV